MLRYALAVKHLPALFDAKCALIAMQTITSCRFDPSYLTIHLKTNVPCKTHSASQEH